DRAIGAIDVHTRDRGEDLILAETDVARRAHRNVEFAIRAEGDEFPAVRCFIGITFDHDLRLRWIIEVILDVLQPYNAIQRAHVQITFAESHTGGHVQPTRDHERSIGAAITIVIAQSMYDACLSRSHEQRSFFAPTHGTCVLHILREHRYTESFGQLDMLQFRIATEGGGHAYRGIEDGEQQCSLDQGKGHLHGSDALCSNYRSRSMAGTISTGTRLSRSTCSLTLPTKALNSPDRPCDPMMIISAFKRSISSIRVSEVGPRMSRPSHSTALPAIRFARAWIPACSSRRISARCSRT